jgi:hypothetical protein
MNEKELITSLNSHLTANLSVPVRTLHNEDERPVPVVVIDTWDTEDLNFHNSPFAGEIAGDFDNDSVVEYERYLNFDFTTRVTFSVRHSDEVEANVLKGRVKNLLRLIRANPLQFDPEVKNCRLGSGGNPSNQFTEPREAELMLSARFHGDHTIMLTPPGDSRGDGDTQADQLETVKDTFTFNPQ